MDWKPGDEFNQSVADAICDKIVAGMYLPAICEDEAMPSRAVVYKWLHKHSSFEEEYAQACRIRSYAQEDRLHDIASGRHRFQDLPFDEEGKRPAHNPINDTKEWVARDRLMADMLRWDMARSNPRRFGDVKLSPKKITPPPTKVIEMHEDSPAPPLPVELPPPASQEDGDD